MKIALLILMAASSVLASGYPVVVPRFEVAVKEEMREWEIGGIATAWVDGTRIVHEAGYGEAQKDSVFRCGSVSKLFNAIAVMQQVEEGKLDLDAPVDKYLPGVMPINPFVGSPPVTLRHLLSHRSGLQRESSVGSYFDPDEPGILKSIESLRGNALITVPNAKTRYSNIGPTLAGHCVEVITSLDYETYQAKHVLGPLGMTHSAWRHASLPNGTACLKSHMRMADGKGGFPRKDTPVFDLGTIPAGNLFTTAGDLARFIGMLAADGQAPGGRVLAKETLRRMFQPQHEEKGAFGIGFALGELEGHKTVGHGGAVYGHSTQLIYLPGEKIGVVVLANEDIANGRTSRLAALAVQLMLEAKLGVKQPERVSEEPKPSLSDFAGDYESQSYWVELRVKDGELRGNFSSQPCVFVPVKGDTFILRSRIHADVPVDFSRDANGKVTSFSALPQVFQRVPAKRPQAPASWSALYGSYGPDFIPLVVFEKFGHLYASTENMVDYRLTPITRHIFSMPPGMYIDEHVVFHVNEAGNVVAAENSSMMLPRRQ
jgi:CubicO group peptidase (beta-lactamase class C family)